jgi:hypothetical protein
METTIVKLKPVPYYITELEIHSVSLRLDKGAHIQYILKGDILHLGNTLELTPDEYAAWGNDDNYIVDLLLSKLSLEKA